MRLRDADVGRLLKMFSFRPERELETMLQQQLDRPKPWRLQRRLAEEMTLLVHGEDGLASARRITEAFFSKDLHQLGSLAPEEISAVFEGAEEYSLEFVPGNLTVLDVAMRAWQARALTHPRISPGHRHHHDSILYFLITRRRRYKWSVLSVTQTMAEDGQVPRQLWDSHLPVAFHLSPTDLQSIKDPEPYYVSSRPLWSTFNPSLTCPLFPLTVDGAPSQLLQSGHRQGGRLLFAIHRPQHQIGRQSVAGLSRCPTEAVSCC